MIVVGSDSRSNMFCQVGMEYISYYGNCIQGSDWSKEESQVMLWWDMGILMA